MARLDETRTTRRLALACLLATSLMTDAGCGGDGIGPGAIPAPPPGAPDPLADLNPPTPRSKSR